MLSTKNTIYIDANYEPIIESEESAKIREYKQRCINSMSTKLAADFASITEKATGFANDLKRQTVYNYKTKLHTPYPNHAGGIALFELMCAQAIADYRALLTLFLEINYWDGDCIQPKILDKINNK